MGSLDGVHLICIGTFKSDMTPDSDYLLLFAHRFTCTSLKEPTQVTQNDLICMKAPELSVAGVRGRKIGVVRFQQPQSIALSVRKA